MNQTADNPRAERAEQVDEEYKADPIVAEIVGGRQQAEADVIVERDETTH